jgi:GNAT superfamily N-acetyltransferase
VAPSARGRGFGRQLVEAIAEWARTRSASRLELSVSERAETAAALYRQLGFAPTGEQQPLESDPSLTEVFLSRHL